MFNAPRYSMHYRQRNTASNRSKALLLVLIVSLLPVYSQKTELGFHFGYGKSRIDSNPSFIHPFSKYDEHTYELGFAILYTPKKAIFSVVPGLQYSSRGNYDIRFHYFRIPIGVDVQIGMNLVKFHFGMGAYGSTIFSEKATDQYILNGSESSTFQIGWYGNAGFSFQLSRSYCIEILFQRSADLSKTFERLRYSSSGSSYTQINNGYDGIIRLGIKYSLASG